MAQLRETVDGTRALYAHAGRYSVRSSLAAAKPENEVECSLRRTVENVVADGHLVSQLEPLEDEPASWSARKSSTVLTSAGREEYPLCLG